MGEAQQEQKEQKERERHLYLGNTLAVDLFSSKWGHVSRRDWRGSACGKKGGTSRHLVTLWLLYYTPRYPPRYTHILRIEVLSIRPSPSYILNDERTDAYRIS